MDFKIFEFSLPDRERLKNIFTSKGFLVGIISGMLITTLLIMGIFYYMNLDHRQPVDVTVVTCDNCSYTKFTTSTDRMFNADYRVVDYQSDEGQRLIEEYGFVYVPAFIFDAEVAKTENFFKIRPTVVEVKNHFVIPDEGNEVAQRLSKGKYIE